MAREAGLKVRIVTGEGFNGKEWGPHSWNEVYLPEKNQWITVDPTFGKAGNYFDSKKAIFIMIYFEIFDKIKLIAFSQSISALSNAQAKLKYLKALELLFIIE